MVCAAALSVDVVHVATPLPFNVWVLVLPSLQVMGVALSRNCTVPVGVPGVPAGEPVGLKDTVAVKVTGSPWKDGEPLVWTAVVVLKRSACVSVGSLAPPTAGSSVFGLPVDTPLTSVKLLPNTRPWLLTRGGFNELRPGRLFSVTLKTIVRLLPTGSVKPDPPLSTVTVSPPGGGTAASKPARLADFAMRRPFLQTADSWRPTPELLAADLRLLISVFAAACAAGSTSESTALANLDTNLPARLNNDEAAGATLFSTFTLAVTTAVRGTTASAAGRAALIPGSGGTASAVDVAITNDGRAFSAGAGTGLAKLARLSAREGTFGPNS